MFNAVTGYTSDRPDSRQIFATPEEAAQDTLMYKLDELMVTVEPMGFGTNGCGNPKVFVCHFAVNLEPILAQYNEALRVAKTGVKP